MPHARKTVSLFNIITSLILILLLSACKPIIQEELYKVTEVSITFPEVLLENDEKQAFFDNLGFKLANRFANSYIDFREKNVRFYQYYELDAGALKKDTIYFNNGTFKIEKIATDDSQKEGAIILSSDDYDICSIWGCSIQIEIKEDTIHNPDFAFLITQIAESQKRLQETEQQLQHEISRRLNNDFLGEWIELPFQYSIKLTPAQTLTFAPTKLPEFRQYQSLTLDPHSEGLKAFRFYNFSPQNSPVKVINSSAILLIVPFEQGNASFDHLKKQLTKVFFEDRYGFIGEHPLLGNVAFYHYFDAERGYYILGQSTGDQHAVIDHFISFTTISHKRLRDIRVSLEDIILSSDQFEERYGIDYQFFTQDQVEVPAYFNAIANILRGIGQKNYQDNAPTTVTFSPQKLAPIQTLVTIHPEPINRVMQELARKHPQSARLDNFLIHSSRLKTPSGLSYLYPLKENQTLEIEIPYYMGTSFEKLLYAKQLEALDFSKLSNL